MPFAKCRPYARLVLLAAAVAAWSAAVAGQKSPPQGSIETAAMKRWLTYIASDELQGREVYTEGLGLAASYIARHLAEWGVKPAGDEGSYFQSVKVRGVRNTGRSSVTVDVKGQRRTFYDGEGISLPRNIGRKRTVNTEDLYFVGSGGMIPSERMDGHDAIDWSGTAVVWLGGEAPPTGGNGARASTSSRARSATGPGAVAVIGPALPAGHNGPDSGQPADEDRASRSTPDFVTAQRLDASMPPTISAQDEFLDFLFSGSSITYGDLKALVEKRQPLPRFALKGVKLTINIDAEYSVVSTRLSRNVVGIVEGNDPALKNTYVVFGAHYDHIGYQEVAPSGPGTAVNAGGCSGQARPRPRADDVVNNGADDDGSGTVALMAMARAFALGPRPKRSLVFVWHTAEESGLQGSRYNADYPVVPNDKVIALLNVDMIGRNRCDQASESNTVYLVGSDRISTDLHNISEDANVSLPRPLELDYELNDPADPLSLYTRSDHYSYAAKGIPVIFYTTGLHRDYHYLTDEIDKIDWSKLTRVTQLVYTTGQRLANLERAPFRDNRGPRVGKGRRGKIK